MKQSALFKDVEPQDESIKQIGYRLYLKFSDSTPAKTALYHNNTLVKTIELSDKVAKKLLVVEAVEMGAEKKALAAALGITRQTVHNYIEINKYFGLAQVPRFFKGRNFFNIRIFNNIRVLCESGVFGINS